MRTHVSGIHHVTAIAGKAQQNVAFHTDVLGLRLVKRTVNFDDPYTYHLYYGDEVGSPGTIMTFFPFEHGTTGTVGRGQPTATAYAVPDGSIEFWRERLDDHGVDVDDPIERFGERVLPFGDPDGQRYELVTAETDIEPWEGSPVPAEYAIRGFVGVTLDSLAPEETGTVLETMGFEPGGTKGLADGGTRTRYRIEGERAAVVDLLERSNGRRGRQGVGTVHHVAFRTPDDETQASMAERITDIGLSVTPQKDRQYFRSVYFREKGGILFEIATDGPGFTRDESVANLGSSLCLPPWLEADRDTIEGQLPELSSNTQEVQ